MIITMDQRGEKYHWVLENNIQHTVTNRTINFDTLESEVRGIDIPDDSKDLAFYLLRWA